MALTEIQRIKQKEYRKKVGLEKYREQRRAYQKEWTRKNPDYRKNMRIKCLSHYGGNPAKCACCEEKTYEFLGIDHINGKGNKHRKEVGTKKRRRDYLPMDYPKQFSSNVSSLMPQLQSSQGILWKLSAQGYTTQIR